MSVHPYLFNVDGKPFFVLGAQPGTNNTYLPGGLRQFWRAAEALRINTAEMQVFWEMIEPEEGVYVFDQVDRLIRECEEHQVKMIMTWFGAWKNGCMKYAPAYVKVDKDRFRRAKDVLGCDTLNLSTYCEENYRADCDAFCALIEHLKIADVNRTVLAVQVENESGLFGKCVRDHDDYAEQVFRDHVPYDLLRYLDDHPDSNCTAVWQANGHLYGEDWETTFGRDAAEYFSAYSVASFIGREAQEAKVIYDIPMYANAWLMHAAFEEPGIDYPSGGPVKKVLDIWKCAAPALDCICPDNYAMSYQLFYDNCRDYDLEDNLLFIPESPSHTAGNWQPFVAIGDFDCQGYCCMGHVYDIVKEDRLGIVQSFRDIRDLAPILPDYYGSGKMYSVVQQPGMKQQLIAMEGWKALIHFNQGIANSNVPGNFIDTHKANGAWGAGLIIQAGPNEFYIVGNDFTVEFRKAVAVDEILPEHALVKTTQTIDYLYVDEGYFEEDKTFTLTNKRNGDSNDYGIVLLPRTRVIHVGLNT